LIYFSVGDFVILVAAWKNIFSLACSTDVWSGVVQGQKANKGWGGGEEVERLFWLEKGGGAAPPIFMV
jgi:hypothetical protein